MSGPVLTRDDVGRLSDEAAILAARRPWLLLRRPEQAPPEGAWRVWLCLAGRGWGKTRTGAEWCIDRIEAGASRLALVGPTAADARDVMVEGESGILAVAPRDARPEYRPALRRLVWPSGAQATLYSADEPERLRGPQHDAAWADELAAWRYPESWDQLAFGLRLGDDPRCVATTTPKPIPLVRQLVSEPSTVITRGRTLDNADNLPPAFLERITARYEGTRLGRQELEAEILEDMPGALWTRAMLEAARLSCPDPLPDMKRIVVAVDPAVTSGEEAAETGIIVAARGVDDRGYVLADRTCRLSPDGWARRAVATLEEYRADRIVAEANQGGDLVESVLRTVRFGIPYRRVYASRGKRVRAEPIAALYEQGRVSHVEVWPELEDQLALWTPDAGESPDRLDALVWALTDLGLGPRVQGPGVRREKDEARRERDRPLTAGMLGRHW